MNTLISICIPTYNGEKYLSQTLDSIKKQTIVANCEVVIVDDCSSDSTIQIAEKFKDEFSGDVHIYQNEHNLGLVGNWNRCLELVNGDWIQFLFQDDVILPSACETFLSAANVTGCRLLLCDRQFVFENVSLSKQDKFENLLPRITSQYPNCKISPEETLKVLLKNFITNFLGEPVCGFFHKNILREYGRYDDSLRQICDFEFWLRIAANESIFVLDEKLVKFRVHDESQTSKNRTLTKLERYYSDRFVLCESLMTEDYYRIVHSGKLRNEFEILINEMMKKVIQRYGLYQVRKFTRKSTWLDNLAVNLVKKKPSLFAYTAYRELQHWLS